jgi:group I intron endonuclease
MHYLYTITNTLNNKVYIGQTVDNKKRWMQHKAYAKHPEKTGQYIHRAMAKYGIENFTFEIIAACQTQEDANETESVLINQYDSRNKECGYNLMIGGSYGGHSDETKQKQREATLEQIATKGHPAQDHEVSQETRDLLRKIRLENPIEYTPELRQKMSSAHLGKIIPDEQRKKMADAIKEQWKIRGDYDSKKCEAPGCEASGKIKYKIIDGIRYCNKHGLRMLRYGRLDTLTD